MTPEFARAVDPVIAYVVGLLDRIRDDKPVDVEQQRAAIVSLLERGGAVVGEGRSWQLAKYALVSWIDEMLVETPWSDRDWWSNNVLEVELFNTRLCFEQFFVWGREAAALEHRDALEVYYVCVVLGFRGLYRNQKASEQLLRARGLPLTLEGWAKQTSLAIEVGQGRDALPAPQREFAGAPPLRAATMLVWSCFWALSMVTVSLVVFVLLFGWSFP
ncbi:MAG: DotU family type IV/VI secretion system protein [Pirellulaceae bacterium]